MSFICGYSFRSAFLVPLMADSALEVEVAWLDQACSAEISHLAPATDKVSENKLISTIFIVAEYL